MTRAPVTLRAWRCGVPLTTLGCLLVFNCCAAARTLRTRTTDAAGDATALELIDELVVDRDGGSLHRHHRRVLVETPLASAALADQHLCHRDGATLGLVRVEARRGGGAAEPATQSGSVGDELCAGAAATRLRLGRLTAGTTVELEVEESLAAQARPWSAVVPLATWYPIARRTVIVRLPPATPLVWSCLACPTQPELRADPASGTHTFAWTGLTAVPVPDKRAARLALGHGQPRLVLSTTDSWTAMTEPLRDRFRAAAAITDLGQRQGEALREAAPTRALAITAARRFVAEQVTHHAPVSWQPRPIDALLTDGLRDALDQAVVLHALLGHLGVASRPVLVAGEAAFAREVPALEQFATVWLAASTPDGETWIDPTTLRGTGLAALSGLELLDLDSGIFEAPPATSEPSVSSLDGVLIVRRDGSVRAELTLVLAGVYSPFYDLPPSAAELLDRFVPAPTDAPWQVDCDGCAVTWRELSAAQSVATIVAESRALAIGRFWAVALPQPARSQLRAPRVRGAPCLGPLALDGAGLERWALRIEFPDQLALASHPPAAVLTNNAGQLSITSRMIGSTLTLGGELLLPARLLDRDACLSVHDLRRELGRANNQLLLLERRDASATPGAGAAAQVKVGVL